MTYLLYSHVVAGLAGLLVGLVAMISKKYSQLHHASGQIYFWLMAFICLTGGILPFYNWSKNWWLLPVSVVSFGFALKGWLAERHRKDGWLTAHIKGMLGSYIALVTAFIVVNVHRFEFLKDLPAIIFWILPTICGVPLIRKVVLKWMK
jgi:uncharacterized membrane protein